MKASRVELEQAVEAALERAADDEAAGRLPPGSLELAQHDFMAPAREVDRAMDRLRFSAPSCRFDLAGG